MTSDNQPSPAISCPDADLDNMRIGEHAQEIRLTTRVDNQRMAAALVAQAVRTVEIFSRDLEADIYDQPAFLDGIKALALSSRHVRIRILLQDACPVVRDGHRLVDIMRKLSSFIEIRQPHEDYRSFNEAFLIVDGVGLLHRRLSDRYEGLAGFNLPLRARELGNFFEEVWQRSEPHPDLRRLHI